MAINEKVKNSEITNIDTIPSDKNVISLRLIYN